MPIWRIENFFQFGDTIPSQYGEFLYEYEYECMSVNRHIYWVWVGVHCHKIEVVGMIYTYITFLPCLLAIIFSLYIDM